MSILQKIRGWFRREAEKAAELGEGPIRDPDRETSTNAQVEGAAGEPYPGNE